MTDRRPKRKKPVDMNLFDPLQDNDHDELVSHSQRRRSTSSPSHYRDVQLHKIDHKETQPSAKRAIYPLRQFTQPPSGFAYHDGAPFKLCNDVSSAKGDTRPRQVDSWSDTYKYIPHLSPTRSSSLDLRQEIPSKRDSVPTFLVTSTKDTSCDYIFVESSTSLATNQVEVFLTSSEPNRVEAPSTASLQVETDDVQSNVEMEQHSQPKRAKVVAETWNPQERRGKSMDPVVRRKVATDYEMFNFSQIPKRPSNEGDGSELFMCGCQLNPMSSGRRFRCAFMLSVTLKLGDDVESHTLQVHQVQGRNPRNESQVLTTVGRADCRPSG